MPALVFISIRPSVLETCASQDAVAQRDGILHWLGFLIDTDAQLPSLLNVVGRGLIQNTARVTDSLVSWSDLASRTASIVKSHAAILTLHTIKISLATVVSVAKALQDISVLSITAQLMTDIDAYWTYLAFRSCLETVIYQFMSSFTAHRPSLLKSPFQLLQPFYIAFLDTKRAFANWLFLNIVSLLKSYVMIVWTLGVFLFVRRKAIRNFIRRIYILDKFFGAIAAVLRLICRSFGRLATCGIMLRPFSYTITYAWFKINLLIGPPTARQGDGECKTSFY